MNKNENVEEKETEEKTPYEKLIGENHKNEKVDFKWDQIEEELI